MGGGGGGGRLFPVVEEQYQSLAITNACPYRSSPTLLSPIQLKGYKIIPSYWLIDGLFLLVDISNGKTSIVY